MHHFSKAILRFREEGKNCTTLQTAEKLIIDLVYFLGICNRSNLREIVPVCFLGIYIQQKQAGEYHLHLLELK